MLNWDAPTNTVAGVNYYLARIRSKVLHLGTLYLRVMAVLTTSSERQLTPGATYNFETRTWCNTGILTTQQILICLTGVECILQTIPCPYRRLTCTLNVNATTQFFGADFIADGSSLRSLHIRFREVGATAWTFRSLLQHILQQVDVM